MSRDALPPEIHHHDNSTSEARRLFEGTSRIELARTLELARRYLPPPPAVVLDVGGGPGACALWLGGIGYEVHLIDPIPRHVEEARESLGRLPGRAKMSAEVGDAGAFRHRDASVETVLPFGPLYHLTGRAERVAARRVLRGGGVVLAAAISRFASLLGGLFRRWLEESMFAAMVRRDLTDGQHRNPTGSPAWFTTAYFHRPSGLKAELVEAGLAHEATFGTEGPAWLLHNFDDHRDEPGRRRRLLDMARAVETELETIGAGARVLAVGRRR